MVPKNEDKFGPCFGTLHTAFLKYGQILRAKKWDTFWDHFWNQKVYQNRNLEALHLRCQLIVKR